MGYWAYVPQLNSRACDAQSVKCCLSHLFPAALFLDAWENSKAPQSAVVIPCWGWVAAVQSPAGHWRHLAWLMCPVLPQQMHTCTHTHSQGLYKSHSSLTAKDAIFLLPWTRKGAPSPPPSPWKYTNTQWHAIPEPECTQTQPLQVACTQEGGSIVMKDTIKLEGSTPASQDLLPSHFQCVLHDSHREAVTQPSPRTTPTPRKYYSTDLSAKKKKISWAKTNRAPLPSTQFIHLCRPGFMSLKHQTQSNNSAFSTMSSTALQSISSVHKQGDFKVSGSGHSSISVLRGIPEQCSALIQVRTNTQLGISLTHNPLQFERVHIQCPH